MSHHSLQKILSIVALLVCAHVARAQPPATQNAPLLNDATAKRVEVSDVKSVDVAEFGQQTGQTQTPPVTTPAPPAPSVNTPQPAQTPQPGANARPLTPDVQTQQSVQPAPQGGQTPPATEPNTARPAMQQTPAPAVTTQGPQIAPPQGPPAPGRESVPVAAPNAERPLAVPQVAPGYEAAQGPFPELGRVGVDMTAQRPLALREAIALALKNSKDIEVARQNVRVAEFDLLGARGVYDPRASSLSYYERTETPASSFLSGANGSVKQADWTGTFRLEGLTPKGGGGYRVDFSSIRLTTNNQFASLNPQFPTALTFAYTQPLLRGFRFDQNRQRIEIAKKNLTLTDAQFRQRAIETITQVQRAYWDLVFALRNLQVQREAVRDARTQLEHNKRLVAEGMLAPIDVVAAEAQVSGFEQTVYTALDDVNRAENILKNLIAEDRLAQVWNVALVPTDTVDVEPPIVALDEAMSAALRSRPEVQQSDVLAAINELDTRLAREQEKPQVDLVGSYGVVGLAGTINDAAFNNPLTASNAQLRDRINVLSQLNGLPLLPPAQQQTIAPNLIGSLPQSLTNLAANRYNNFRVGVQLNLPLRNRTAEAALGRSLVEGERIKTQREQLEQLIQVDVRNALQQTRTAESRLRAAAAARDASEQQYASEKRKFDAGQSTIFLVLERQTALTNARGSELRAQTELNKAIADLQRATGNALEANHVQVSVR
jgi:outer membrane protein